MQERKLLYDILGYMSAGAVLFPMFIAVLRYHKITTLLKPVAILIFLSFIMEILNITSKATGLFYTLHIIHFFTVFEFLLFNHFYKILFKSHYNSYIFLVTLILFIGVNIIDMILFGLLAQESISVILECLILIVFSLLYFLFLLKNPMYDNLLEEPTFWINSAVLFYFGGNLFFFALTKYIPMEISFERAVLQSTVHTFFNVIYNVFLGIGIWKTKRT